MYEVDPNKVIVRLRNQIGEMGTQIAMLQVAVEELSEKLMETQTESAERICAMCRLADHGAEATSDS